VLFVVLAVELSSIVGRLRVTFELDHKPAARQRQRHGSDHGEHHGGECIVRHGLAFDDAMDFATAPIAADGAQGTQFGEI
jgi:hypothetical protein